MEIQHRIHKHPMTQYDLDKERLTCRTCDTPLDLLDCHCPKCKRWYGFSCSACGEKARGRTCVCKACDLSVHRSCADKWPEQMKHPFHPLHPLKLYYRPSADHVLLKFTCSACQKTSRLFAYNCEECSFGLCLECVLMDPKIKIEDGNHILYLYENTAFERLCSVCNEKDRHAFIFICMVPKCGYAVHLHCTPLPIPESVNHLYHYHTLALTKPEVEAGNDKDKDSDREEEESYYYCDVCEQRRNARHPVYHCKECAVSAHVACGIGEVLPALVAEYMAGLRSNGDIPDPYLENIESELVELREKEKELRADLEALSPKLKELKDERARYVSSPVPPEMEKPPSG